MDCFSSAQRYVISASEFNWGMLTAVHVPVDYLPTLLSESSIPTASITSLSINVDALD
jgi:hypothetical protein